jgi:hypothetical protein
MRGGGGDVVGVVRGHVDVKKEVKEYLRGAYRVFSNTILARLPSSVLRALFLSNRAAAPGHVFKYLGGAHASRNRLAPFMFVCALRGKVGMRPAWNHGGVPASCTCRAAEPEVAEEGLNHALLCQDTKGLRTARHTAVVELLVEALRGHRGGGVVSRGREYPRVAEEGAEGGVVRTDLEFTERGGTCYRLDVVVSDPTAKSSRDKWRSDQVAGAAAEGAAREKRRSYEGILPTGVGQCFVPFSVESTGRLGVDAREFLETVFPAGSGSAAAKNALLSNMAFTMVRFNAYMTERCYNRVINA